MCPQIVVFGLQHDRRALGQLGHGDCHPNGSGMLIVLDGGEADPEMAGVPDFTDEKGMAILQTRHIVAELLECVKAMTKPTRPEDGNKKG
jgi:hypothetical protein